MQSIVELVRDLLGKCHVCNISTSERCECCGRATCPAHLREYAPIEGFSKQVCEACRLYLTAEGR